MTRPYIDPRPDWVITGSTMPDGSVMLMASTELTKAEIEMRRQEHLFSGWDDFAREFSPRVTLAVEMKECVIVTAPTYQEALQILFGKWRPQRWPDSPPELDGPQPLEIQR